MKKDLRKFVYPLIILALIACSSTKNGSGKKEVLHLQVQSLYQQDSYPGIESNLRYTRTYRAVVSAQIDEEISLVSLLVDSIKIPIESLKVDGDIVKNENYTMVGEFDKIEFQASRYFYNRDSRVQMLQEQKYSLSGQIIEEGNAVLEYNHFGTLKYFPLGALESKDPVFHP